MRTVLDLEIPGSYCGQYRDRYFEPDMVQVYRILKSLRARGGLAGRPVGPERIPVRFYPTEVLRRRQWSPTKADLQYQGGNPHLV